jgi:hypothetical protein
MNNFMEGIKAYERQSMLIRWYCVGGKEGAPPLDTGILSYSTMVFIIENHGQDAGPFHKAMEEGKQFRFINRSDMPFILEGTNE